MSTCSVFVKALNGDVIALDVDPALGFKGVADALHVFDPVAFPKGEFQVFFAEEDVAEIVPDTILGVVKEIPCEFVGITTPYRHVRYDPLHPESRAIQFILMEYRIRGTTYYIEVVPPEYKYIYLNFKVFQDRYPADEFNEEFIRYSGSYFHNRCIQNATHVLSDEDMAWVRDSMKSVLLGLPGFRRIHFAPPPNRIVRCECGLEVSYSHLTAHRRTQRHVDRTPRDAVRYKETKLFECDCGSVIVEEGIEKHVMTSKHRRFMENLKKSESVGGIQR